MKMKKIIYALLLSGLCSLTVATGVFAQSSAELTQAENYRIDSLKRLYDADELRTQQVKEDDQHLSNLKSEKSDTKEKAREARRVERDASDAARESRTAYRSEKKAQKARKQADKQAKKASKARRISNAN
jgi:hypothetical protein